MENTIQKQAAEMTFETNDQRLGDPHHRSHDRVAMPRSCGHEWASVDGGYRHLHVAASGPSAEPHPARYSDQHRQSQPPPGETENYFDDRHDYDDGKEQRPTWLHSPVVPARIRRTDTAPIRGASP